MPIPPRVGDQVALPSGASFTVTAPGDGASPWSAAQSGALWSVCRASSIGAAMQLFYGGRRAPVQLNESDAKALAELLNRALPAVR